ncbi:MAG: ATP-dependent protease ATPase subunit HslU [Mariprofundales bacterium]|nr:ATP-dependent protease ATPase subunit HslU [Mariprofundales bacterium]
MDQVMTPREIVSELDRFIIGQNAAKRAVAIALRNRWRRQQVAAPLCDDITPKNILMIGPTGVGKTEIARRLAKLSRAPFIKVEATKYTEVGYMGRDVESIIRDLLGHAIQLVREEHLTRVDQRADEQAEERLLDILIPHTVDQGSVQPIERSGAQQETREKMRAKLRSGALDGRQVQIEVQEAASASAFHLLTNAQGGDEEMGGGIRDMLGSLMASNAPKRKRMSIADARKVLKQQAADQLLDNDLIREEAISRTENFGIVFLDEMDKICHRDGAHGDVSREGVQRDLLPLVEGASVNTRHGMVQTDHILFIAAGAFHLSKPSDLIPEMQGRFPLRVSLDALTEHDFQRILVEPESSLCRQYVALLATEGMTVEFSQDGIAALAAMAVQVNDNTENIGARRLHTLMERVLEEVSFDAPDRAKAKSKSKSKSNTVVVNAEFVAKQLEDLVVDTDLSRYIL